jgi:hypothetical protein
METAPNVDGSTGEKFKLVPVTLNNIKHHLTQSALSQLSIVADINISDAIRKVQVRSKELGSAGAVEIVGGNANTAEFPIVGEAQLATGPESGDTLLQVRTSAFPTTLTAGDYVRVYNTASAKRASRLTATDKIDVVAVSTTDFEYRWSAKDTGFTSGVNFTITDVSTIYGRAAGTVWRWTHDGGVTLLDDVAPGDLLHSSSLPAGWSSANTASVAGDNRQSGFPVIAVDTVGQYVDIHNPDGVAMASTALGTGSVTIHPSPFDEWKLSHHAKVSVAQVVVSSGTATVTTNGDHRLTSGLVFDLEDNGAAESATVATVTDSQNFTYTSTAADGTYLGGFVSDVSKTVTKYKIESLNFGGLYRLSYLSGEAPRFIDNGVAVDDVMIISGSTFAGVNTGSFRVLAVDDVSVLFESTSAIEELDTVTGLNNLDTAVTWISNLNEVTGVAGAFKNVNIGDWVKKNADSNDKYAQVISLLDGSNAPTTADLAVKIILGQVYGGTTGTSTGVRLDQTNGIGAGLNLDAATDIRFFEGDSVRTADSLFVDNIANTSWFSSSNSGNFEINQFGTASTGAPFVRVTNANGVSETNRELSISTQGFFIIEGVNNKYESIRVVEHSVIDTIDNNRRNLYLSPSTKSDKVSQSNGTTVAALGKMQFPTGITTGIDGYTYYTGLLRTAQRILDGYEPEASTYPGIRAVGAGIEILPPLINRVSLSLDVTTNDGVNINEISNDVKSVVIDYIDGLGVGEDVILSEVTVSVMQITGVLAVRITSPANIDRIAIADNEKSFIESSDISVF